jgi:hypothetical protein
MSLSSRSFLRFTTISGVTLSAIALSRLAAAQEVAFVPQGELSTEWTTNRQLSIPASPNAEDYMLSLGGDLIRRTEVSDIDLRPLVTVQESPKVSDLDRFEALVDLLGNYRTLRGEFSVRAQYHREDAYNSQYGLVAFKPINPNLPDTTGTGAVVTGVTRTTYDVEPDFSYDLSPRVSLVGGAEMLAVRYSTDVPGLLVSYDSPEVDVGLAWALSQNSHFSVGPYYTYYEPVNNSDDSVRSNATGISFNYDNKFSAESKSRLTVKIERDTSPAALGAPSSSHVSWGFEWVGMHHFLTGNVQYSIGRFLEPSSSGGRSSVDQIRAQANKFLTARWSVSGAVRLTRSSDIGNIIVEQDETRDRANANVAISYLLTPEWYLSGGYRYAYLNDLSQTGFAHSNAIFISIGYHGLQPPRN